MPKCDFNKVAKQKCWLELDEGFNLELNLALRLLIHMHVQDIFWTKLRKFNMHMKNVSTTNSKENQ